MRGYSGERGSSRLRQAAAVVVMGVAWWLFPQLAVAQPTLRSGSSGPDVKFLQRLLNERVNAGLTVDGAFGPRTQTAVRTYQTRAGLTADGVVGARTWTQLLTGYGSARATFPLRRRPSVDYRTGGRYFGAPRDGGRAHAACDLIGVDGTEVLAIQDGTVTAGPYLFYQNTYAIEVQHTNFVARYGELRAAAGIRAGVRVTRGQVIGYLQRNRDGTAMLHLEMYKGTASGALTQGSNTAYDFVPQRGYQRRRDLLNATYYLDRWALP